MVDFFFCRAVCLLNNRLLDACFSLLLLLSFENPSIDGARSPLHSSTAVTTISINPGHVTDILLWPVFFFPRSLPPPPPAAFISYSHGGVGESRRWSKHCDVLIFCSVIIIFYSSVILPDCTVLSSRPRSRKPSAELPCCSQQPWPTAASICRLCLKRSETSWPSWIWSSPKVSWLGLCRGSGD